MNKKYGVKKLFVISAVVSYIFGGLAVAGGIFMLIFSPIGKVFGILIIIAGICSVFSAKKFDGNEININDEYVYIKYGGKEVKLLYGDIISVHAQRIGTVLFDTKMGVYTVACIEDALECAEFISQKLENGVFVQTNIGNTDE